jgi:3-hydroxyacyl-CoA dehydrogenase
MAMGPLATGDLAGLDVGWRIRKEYREMLDHSVRQPLIEDRLCEMGRYGQKTGSGWYRYDEDRRPQHDPEIDWVFEQCRADTGLPQREIGAAEIVERTIYALVNEGARILEEGYALRSVDIDVIYVTGYGFPAYRGGPMWYADAVGLQNVYRRVCQFEAQHGKLWAPAPLLKHLAEEGKKFSDFVAGPAAAKGVQA